MWVQLLLFVSASQSNLLLGRGLYCIFMVADFCTALTFFGKRGWVVERERNPPLAPSIFWISFIWFEDQISQTGQGFCLQDGAKCLQRARLWRSATGLNQLLMCRMSCYCNRGKLRLCLKNTRSTFLSYQHIYCCLQH